MRSYFEGWYFKQQGACGTVALIPALHIDTAGQASASLQIVVGDSAYCVPYAKEEIWAQRGRLHVAGSVFSAQGVRLNVRAAQINAVGRLHFGRFTPLGYDIMGPFCAVPFMECRHSVFSMAHSVNGSLTIAGRRYHFDDALGYAEGDRGHSFPKRYVWTQYSWRDRAPCSLMLSVADIPLLGGSFTGVIGVVLWRGRQYRLATYLGARATHIGRGGVAVRQGPYTLCAQRLEQGGFDLHAPVRGAMTRQIRESPACRVHYAFTRDGDVLFDFCAPCAGFEYEYDV
ncbi:MAG: tocopherol cyclase family protein [Eubacteriales bacterium]|nr:tocopherol cyclase family protein [Eubacteriales bacterium]